MWELSSIQLRMSAAALAGCWLLPTATASNHYPSVTVNRPGRGEHYETYRDLPKCVSRWHHPRPLSNIVFNGSTRPHGWSLCCLTVPPSYASNSNQDIDLTTYLRSHLSHRHWLLWPHSFLRQSRGKRVCTWSESSIRLLSFAFASLFPRKISRGFHFLSWETRRRQESANERQTQEGLS